MKYGNSSSNIENGTSNVRGALSNYDIPGLVAIYASHTMGWVSQLQKVVSSNRQVKGDYIEIGIIQSLAGDKSSKQGTA